MDLDKKLLLLSSHIGIKLHPSNNLNFIRNIIDSFLLKLYILNRYNKNYNNLNEALKIFDKKFLLKIKNKKNVLIVPERSGSTYLRNIINTYLAKIYKVSSGEPIYSTETDHFKFDKNFVVQADYWGLINSDTFYINNKIKKDNLDTIFFSRFPNGRLSTFLNLDNDNIFILVRDPIEVIRSSYIHRNLTIKNNQYIINENISIKHILKKFLSFYFFWNKRKNNKNVKITSYELLIKNCQKELLKIFNFFNFEVDSEYLSDAISINSKDNYKKIILNENKGSKRFSILHDPDLVVDLNKKIHEEVKKSNIYEIYKSLIG